MCPSGSLHGYLSSVMAFFLFLLAGCVCSTAQEDTVLRSQIDLENREAKELLERAKKTYEKGFPKDAFTLFVKLYRNYPNAMLPKESGVYVPVSRLVRDTMQEWGEERIELFREYVRGDANFLYEQAMKSGRLDAFRQVANLYFSTDVGRKAMEHLARVQYKEGNISSAVRWWKRILRHPASPHQELRYHLRLLTGYRHLGRNKKYEQTLKQIRRALDERPERENTKYASVLEHIKHLSKQSPPSREKKYWPKPGGNDAGTGTVSSAFDQFKPDSDKTSLLLLWRYPDRMNSGRSLFASDAPLRKFRKPTALRIEGDFSEDYGYSPIKPITHEQQMFVCDGSNVLAFDPGSDPLSPDSGSRKKLLWSAPGDAESMNQKTIRQIYKNGYGYRSLTAKNGSVYFWLKDKLYGIRARDGKKRFDPVQAPVVDDRTLAFNGTPLVYQDQIFVPMVKKIKGKKEFEIYVSCFSRHSGELKWNRFLGVSYAMFTGRRRRRNRDPDASHRMFSHLVRRHDTLYLASNMGLVSAISTTGGTIRWVHDYTTESNEEGNTGEWFSEQNARRGFRPPKIHNDTLYVLPHDSPRFYGFDLKTGELVRSVRCEGAELFVDIDTMNGKERAFLYGRDPNMEETTGTDGKKEYNRSSNWWAIYTVNLSAGDTSYFEKRKSGTIPISQVSHDNSVQSIVPTNKNLTIASNKKLSLLQKENLYRVYVRNWPGDEIINAFHLMPFEQQMILTGTGGMVGLTAVGLLDSRLSSTASENGTDTLFRMLNLLISSGFYRSAKERIHSILSSNRTNVPARQERRLRDVYTTLVLKQMAETTDLEQVMQEGKNVLELVEPGVQNYSEIVVRYMSALEKKNRFEDLLDLHERLLQNLSDDRYVSFRRNGPFSRPYHILLVRSHIQIQLRRLLGKKEQALKASVRKRIRTLQRSLRRSMAGDETGQGADGHASTGTSREKPGRSPSADPVERVLQNGWTSLLDGSSKRFQNALERAKARNRDGLLLDLYRILEQRDQKTVHGRNVSDLLNRIDSVRSSKENASFDGGRTASYSMSWMDGRAPDTWFVEDTVATHQLPVVLTAESGPLTASRSVSIDSQEEGHVVVYDPESGKMVSRISLAPYLDPFQKARYRARVHLTKAGLVSVLLQDLEETSTTVMLYTPGGATSEPDPLMQHELPGLVARRVRFSPTQFVVEGRKTLSGTDVETNTVLEGYGRTTGRRLWTRVIPNKVKVHWFQPTWRPGDRLFVLAGPNPSNDEQIKYGKNPTDTETKMNRFFSSDQTFGLDYIRNPRVIRTKQFRLYAFDQASGMVSGSLALSSPQSVLETGTRTNLFVFPGKSSRYVTGVNRFSGNVQWIKEMDETSAHPVLSSAGDTAYLLFSKGKIAPKGVQQARKQYFHRSDGFVIESLNSSSPSLTPLDLSSLGKKSLIHVFPSPDPTRMYLYRRNPNIQMKNSGRNEILKIATDSTSSYDGYEIQLRSTDVFMPFLKQDPANVIGREAPGQTFVVFNNYEHDLEKWRGYLYGPSGRLVWATPDERSPESSKSGRLTLPEGVAPGIVESRSRIPVRWGEYIFEIAPED